MVNHPNRSRKLTEREKGHIRAALRSFLEFRSGDIGDEAGEKLQAEIESIFRKLDLGALYGVAA